MTQPRLILAAALAATTLFAACGDKTADDDKAGDAASTGSTAATSNTLTTDALLTDDDTVYSDGADWFRTSAFEGDGQDVFNPCAESSIEGTGATRVVRADFELRNTQEPATPVSGDYFIQVAGQYDDDAAAKAAYDDVVTWVTDCERRPTDFTEYKFLDSRDVTVDGATAQILDSHYGPVPKEVDPYGDSAYIMETGVLLKGDRLTVLTSVIVGQDYNFDRTPVEQMLVPAGDRLGKGDTNDTSTGSTSAPAPSGSPSTGSGSSALPSGFDLTEGMLENDDRTPVKASSTEQGVGPLAYCETKVNLTAHVDERLAANASGPEYGEGREVLVFSDEAAAEDAVTALLDAARACPEQDYSGTIWQHQVKEYDAAIPTDVITRTYKTGGEPSLGLDTLTVSRAGNIVLLASRSSEGSAADADSSATTLLKDLATVIDSL